MKDPIKLKWTRELYKCRDLMFGDIGKVGRVVTGERGKLLGVVWPRSLTAKRQSYDTVYEGKSVELAKRAVEARVIASMADAVRRHARTKRVGCGS